MSNRVSTTLQPGTTALPHLMTIWEAGSDLAQALPRLKAYAGDRCKMTLDPDEIDVTGIRNPHATGADGDMPLIYAESANSHVDLMHPAWTAILVVQAAGHHLGIVDFRPNKPCECDDYPSDAPRALAVLESGQIVIMSDHHTHWMTAAEDGSRFIGIHLEYEERPEPADAVRRFERILEAHGFGVKLDAPSREPGA